tara:strand:- start:4246 stop:5466 length:1221 start_codon:yes stop_codon:yes gene_type:complete
MKTNKNIFLFSFIISLCILLIIIFPNKFYWVDDYYIIKDIEENGLKNIFNKFNSHFIVFTKFLFFLDIKFFNYNPQIYSFLSLILIILSFFVLIKTVKNNKFDQKFIFLFLFIIFSPKIFVSISQPINITWFLSVFLTSIFFYYYGKNLKLSLIFLYLNFLNFSFGIVLCFFLILKFLFKKYYKNSHKNDAIFFTNSIFLLFLYLFFNEGSSNIILADLYRKVPIIIFNFFSLLGNFYLPWIKSLVYLGFIIGIVQFLIMKFIFRLDMKNILNNNFILFGIIFCLLTSVFRPELYNSISPRYVLGTMFFQIGFIIEFLKIKKIKKKTFISYVFSFIIMINFFTPYLGFHWQINRAYKSKLIEECFYKNKVNDKCYKLSQKILFYNKMTFNKNRFKNIIDKTMEKKF